MFAVGYFPSIVIDFIGGRTEYFSLIRSGDDGVGESSANACVFVDGDEEEMEKKLPSNGVSFVTWSPYMPVTLNPWRDPSPAKKMFPPPKPPIGKST